LAEEPRKHVECAVLPNHFAGVQLWPRQESFPEGKRSTEKALKHFGRFGEFAELETLALARLFSLQWTLSCQFEPSSSRYSINIPEEIRKSGVLPSEGALALYANKDLFEIWPANEYMVFLRRTKASHSELIEKLRLAETD
jgi:hypothetical protein